jgi:hypothetical protein
VSVVVNRLALPALCCALLLMPGVVHARTGGGSMFRADGPRPAGSFSVLDLLPDDGQEPCADAAEDGNCRTTARRMAALSALGGFGLALVVAGGLFRRLAGLGGSALGRRRHRVRRWRLGALAAAAGLVPLALGVPWWFIAVVWCALAFVAARVGPPLVDDDLPARPVQAIKALPMLVSRAKLAEVVRKDPAFSRGALLDFVRLLVHALVEWPGTTRERALSMFFQPTALEEALRRRGAGRLESPVVGPVVLRRFETRGAEDLLTMEFEALMTRRPLHGSPLREAVRLRWVLVRPRHVASQGPDRMELLGCPSCGAPARVGETGNCVHCGVPVRAGTHGWAVAASTELSRRRVAAPGRPSLPPLPRDLPTPVDEQLPIDGFSLADAGGFGTWDRLAAAFENDVARPVLTRLVSAAATGELKPVRHLVGDRLWESMHHAAELGLEGLADCHLEEVEVVRCDYVRIERDRFFDAIVVRLLWRARVYRTDEHGALVEGDPSRPRPFDGVFTFAKRREARHRGERHASSQCPKCLAGLDRLSDTGHCGYCQRKITGGDFGWMLIDVDTPESIQG